MKIIDCCMFYNEFMMLEFRLKELNDMVDYFVLVEATKTHANNEKPLFFNDNKERFQDYLHKIVHVIVDDNPEGEDAWLRENHQRNCIQRGLDTLDLDGGDIVVISDCDEIIDPQILKTFKPIGLSGVRTLNQDMYYYDLTCKANSTWCFAKILNYGTLKTYSCQDIRLMKAPFSIPQAGWHFSYFGDVDFIVNKIKNFAHQEYNNETYLNRQQIESIIASRRDIYLRDSEAQSSFHYLPIEDNSYLPKHYELLVQK